MEAIEEIEVPKKSHHDTSQTDSRRTSIAIQSRRQSRFSIAPRKSFLGMHGSVYGILRGAMHKNVKYENTYHLHPKSNEKIKQKQLKDLIEDTFHHTLKDTIYDSQSAKTLALNISNMLRRKVHEMYISSRYKFIVQVYIGGPYDKSDLFITSRSLWNPDVGDTYASASYTNTKLFAIGIIFGTYYD